jgi:putative redox protein
MPTETFSFAGAHGAELSARLDLPAVGQPLAYAVFAHCFTCGKDIKAASVIARRLAEHGIAVLRFDFTGLGQSQGDFVHETFASNVGDLLSAIEAMNQQGRAPSLLIGHSLGGAAVLAAAAKSPQIKAVATIGAPFDPAHVLRAFPQALEAIKTQGQAEVCLADRPFTISKAFVEEVQRANQPEALAKLGAALMVLHAPLDQQVSIDDAAEIFGAAKHPKSFVSLHGADHLLSNPQDARFVADSIWPWAQRHLALPQPFATAAPEGQVVVASTGTNPFQQAVAMGPHFSLADEPLSIGGGNTGPAPYDFLLAGLGACTSMTLHMYAARKGWPLERAEVRLEHAKIHAQDCQECETKVGKIDRITRQIRLVGPLDSDQRAKLLEIADKCPVHRSLHSEIQIQSALIG